MSILSDVHHLCEVFGQEDVSNRITQAIDDLVNSALGSAASEKLRAALSPVDGKRGNPPRWRLREGKTMASVWAEMIALHSPRA